MINILHIISNKKISSLVTKIFMYALLINLAFIFIFPFLYMIVTSFKTNTDLNDPLVNWIPTKLAFKNYFVAFKMLDYKKYFFNSMFVTALTTMGHLISCSFIGYGFARYKFPGKNFLFFLVIVALIIPVQTIIVPMYIMFSNLSWLNTFLSLIVPTFFGFGLKGALFIFLFKQYYTGLPKELEEAAYIDGCGFIKTYIKIVFPIATSIFIVTIVLSIVWHWNDFYEPSIYIKESSLMLIPSRLKSFVTYINTPPEELMDIFENEDTALNNATLLAATTLVVIPVMVCYGFLQNKFVQGIEHAGLTAE